MTPKEKAKRYDEALRRARKLKEDPTSVFYEYSPSEGDTIADYIFPELKENEDEKIRKAIISGMTAIKGQGKETFAAIRINDCIAWLEKQGKQKPQGKTALEAINEEKVDNQFCIKPVNNVEPKFHEGDWIISNDKKSTYQVIEVKRGIYVIRDNADNHEYHIGIEECEKSGMLWNISDANAGDILYTPKGLGVEGIFLVSGWQQIEGTGKTLCSNIGYRVDDDEIVEGGLGAIWWKGVVDTYYPATKEQRELLFHKMEEAGYEWDVDKKELKKIKDEIEIPFGAKDSELIAESYYIPKGFHAEIDKDKVVIKKGEKPTWSEKYIADVFEKVGLAKIVREQSNDALTIALQDAMIELSKVTLQPKPTTWSEEDKKTLERVIRCIENHDYMNVDDIHWLKSIKDRYTWRASWEQLDALEYHLKHTNENSRLYKDTKKLYDQLKKL